MKFEQALEESGTTTFTKTTNHKKTVHNPKRTKFAVDKKDMLAVGGETPSRDADDYAAAVRSAKGKNPKAYGSTRRGYTSKI